MTRSAGRRVTGGGTAPCLQAADADGAVARKREWWDGAGAHELGGLPCLELEQVWEVWRVPYGVQERGFGSFDVEAAACGML